MRSKRLILLAAAVLCCIKTFALPLDVVRGHPLVSVQVNEEGPYPFLLDTCLQQPVVDVTLADLLGLERAPLSSEGAEAAWRASVDEIAIDDIPAHAQTVLVTDLSPLQQKLGVPVAGILPAHQPGFEVTIDFANREAVWRPLEKAELQFTNATTFSLKFDDTGKPQVEAVLDGARRTYLVDSALPDCLAVPVEDVNAPPERRRRTVLDAGGESYFEEARLDRLQIGQWTCLAPVVRLEAGPARLGTGFLRFFRVTLNYEYALLRLESTGPKEFEAPAQIGFGIAPTRFLNGMWSLSVVTGSPAAQAGIAPGDLLTAIDGTPVSEMSAQTLEESLRAAEGQVRTFTIDRNGISTLVPVAAARIF